MAEPNLIEDLTYKIGKASVAWTSVHHLVFLAFQRLSGMHPACSDAAFYALKNDGAQRDITLAVARVILRENEQFDTLKAILKDIGKQSGARNEAVHTSWAVSFAANEGPVVSAAKITKARGPAWADSEDFAAKYVKLAADLAKIGERFMAWHRDVQIPSPQKARAQKDQQ
jgi:hypothetical protein